MEKPNKYITIWGAKYKTTLTKKYESRKPWQKRDEKVVVSFIPGTVRKIFLEEGQKVKKGDDILIFEAMKMNNVIKCPFNGTVKSIPLETNQKIPKGAILMEYEEIEK
jgi:biotin carboxyl carrier protein